MSGNGCTKKKPAKASEKVITQDWVLDDLCSSKLMLVNP